MSCDAWHALMHTHSGILWCDGRQGVLLSWCLYVMQHVLLLGSSESRRMTHESWRPRVDFEKPKSGASRKQQFIESSESFMWWVDLGNMLQ